MPIVLDAMGSDDNPVPEILAAVELEKSGEKVVLVGNQAIIRKNCAQLGIDFSQLSIVDAPEVVSMSDKPEESVKTKPNSSMAVGLRMVKEGKADAFVTAGNTGAAFFNAVITLRKMEVVPRPALAVLIPVKTGKCVFMDTGANVDCRPNFLLGFAVMGSVYAGKVFNLDSPKVGLLSNGEEEMKGNQLVKDSHHLLEHSALNFAGNVEPKEVYAGEVDVVVTDGFSGNIFIKSSEAVGKLITETLKKEIGSSFFSKIGYLLAKPAFSKLKKLMDPSETGAAILLGVNGLVFIGHGRSDARALVSAVMLARRSVDAGLLESLRKEIRSKLSITSFSLN